MSTMTWGLTLVVLASCGSKKNAEPAAPIVGWHQEEGWSAACYYSPDFEAMGIGDRRIARNQVREAMINQWSGNRGDGVSFDPELILAIENALLGLPEKTERVAKKNTERCVESMTSGSTVTWGRWLDGLPEELTAGECDRPLDYKLYDYLDIGREWQIPAAVCKEDAIRITGSAIDFYRVSDGGPWINVDGDVNQPAYGDYPCTLETCVVGQLIMRFRGENGMELILPVGTELVWTAPEHGKIEIMINDNSWFDNNFKVEGGMQHHTSIEYSPL